MSEGYNGWTNWETWVTNLWIDEGLLDLFEVGEQARYFAETNDSDPNFSAYEMGKWMREQVESVIDELYFPPISKSSLVSDLVSGCLSSVDWTEIAKHHTDEAIRNEQEQTENANA